MDSLSLSYMLLLGEKPKVVFEKKRFISLSILKIARREREKENELYFLFFCSPNRGERTSAKNFSFTSYRNWVAAAAHLESAGKRVGKEGEAGIIS